MARRKVKVASARRLKSVPETAPERGAQLGAVLVGRGVVKQADVARALMLQTQSGGRRLGRVLIEMGLIDERTLADALSAQMGLPVIDLRRDSPAPEALAKLPESIARAAVAIPIRLTPEGILVAVAEPSDGSVSELSRATGLRVQMALAPETEIRRAIDQAYRALAGIDTQLKAFEATKPTRGIDAQQDFVSADAPVVQIVTMVVTQAARDRASDVHIEPQEDKVRVRFRIDGVLHDTLQLPAGIGPALVSRIKIMAGMNIVERRRPQDGQIATEVDGRKLDIRVATTATIWGEKAVLRLLDKSKQLFQLADLGMSKEMVAVYSRLVRFPFGMVLVAGPTGSGKTTSLYATLNEINTPERNIMTIEDPVEYVFPSVNQIQINEQADVTFAHGLKSILRQDPDVILVGEIRDVETARIAVQSALTGHFVLSSLHATDSASALHRFLDMGIESFLIASSIVAVIAQRLVRRVCRECREVYIPPPEELAFYKEAGGKTNIEFWAGKGCNFCAQTGYQERIGVYELLLATDELKELIVRDASYHELRQLSMKQGMRPLRQEAVRLVADGTTTIAEMMRALYTL
jgi:type IV pilus assembly protein PilB